MSIAQRTCPNCGAGVGFKRLWLFNGWAAEWTCPSCSRRLKFSTRRKLLLAVFRLPIMAGYAYALISREWWWAVGLLLLQVPLSWFDSVVLAGGRKARAAGAPGAVSEG